MPSYPLRCPRDQTRLGAGPLHRCPVCDGTWIDEQSLEEHVGSVVQRGSITCTLSRTRVGLPCAACREPMEPLDLLLEPVDRCKQHGVWFDKGELEAVVRVCLASAPVAAAPSETDAVTDPAAAQPIPNCTIDVVAMGLDTTAEIATRAGFTSVILDILGGLF